MNDHPANQNSNAVLACPKCQNGWSGRVPNCPACSYAASEVSLYNPKHFFVMAIFLGGFVPIWIAARNWRRVGRLRDSRILLFGGGGSLVAVFGLLAWLPEMADGLARGVGYAINLPIGWALRDVQRPMYASWRRLGAGGARSAGQMFLGLAISVVLLLAAVMPVLIVMQSHLDRGITLVAVGNYAVAEIEFQSVLRWDRDDPDALYGAAIAAASLGKWTIAERYLQAYVRQGTDDARAIAMLGLAARARNDEEAALVYFRRAEKLAPGVVSSVETWFGAGKTGK